MTTRAYLPPVVRNHQPSDGARRPRVLIADDHALFRQALTLLLGARGVVDVVGEVDNGRDAVESAERLRPDIVLMDLMMPGLNGIEATRQIARRAAGVRVVALTAFVDDERLLQALRAGATGYVVKSSDMDELSVAIQAVYRGNNYISTSVSDGIDVDEILRQAKQPEGRAGYDLLSTREREVLQLIAEGLGNNAIAAALVISVKTVEAHRAHIMTKLNARNRTDLIRYAIRRGLIGLSTTDADDGLEAS